MLRKLFLVACCAVYSNGFQFFWNSQILDSEKIPLSFVAYEASARCSILINNLLPDLNEAILKNIELTDEYNQEFPTILKLKLQESVLAVCSAVQPYIEVHLHSFKSVTKYTTTSDLLNMNIEYQIDYDKKSPLDDDYDYMFDTIDRLIGQLASEILSFIAEANYNIVKYGNETTSFELDADVASVIKEVLSESLKLQDFLDSNTENAHLTAVNALTTPNANHPTYLYFASLSVLTNKAITELNKVSKYVFSEFMKAVTLLGYDQYIISAKQTEIHFAKLLNSIAFSVLPNEVGQEDMKNFNTLYDALECKSLNYSDALSGILKYYSNKNIVSNRFSELLGYGVIDILKSQTTILTLSDSDVKTITKSISSSLVHLPAFIQESVDKIFTIRFEIEKDTNTHPVLKLLRGKVITE